MLTLLLLRHAKAVQQSRGDDFARDLQEKGRKDCARVGQFLADRDIVPDLALVSASARTRQTFEGVQARIARPIAVRYDDGLYNATAAELRDHVRQAPVAVQRLMVVGHNPGIADAAVMLARDGDAGEIVRMRNKYPPCGLAVISFDRGDWQDAGVSAGRLDLFLLPDDLGA